MLKLFEGKLIFSVYNQDYLKKLFFNISIEFFKYEGASFRDLRNSIFDLFIRLFENQLPSVYPSLNHFECDFTLLLSSMLEYIGQDFA
jgi:hypothetical protein